MEDHYLTKSDFKVARTCPTKLYYRKRGYPTREDGDEYLQLLADQGYLLEALARTLWPDGCWIGFRSEVEDAVWETMKALERDPCTLFEATFISRGKLARVDILTRRGNTLELIEVKSHSFDRQQHDELLAAGQPGLLRTARKPGELRREWQPYVEDAAFQAHVLRELFPGYRVIPYLLMLDSGRPAAVDGLHRQFVRRARSRAGWDAPVPAVDFIGDPREVWRSPFLVQLNVAVEVELVLDEVRRWADEYVGAIAPVPQRVNGSLSTNCIDCQYRVADGDRRGFHECWGPLADPSPHLFDLYRVGELGGRKERLADALIAAGKTSLYDVPEKRLTRQDGSVGEHARRQRIQISHTRSNREWVGEELGLELRGWRYPLHFVDFETCAPAIPRYRGMRPFEVLAFQWCCQTVASADAPPCHDEWIQPTEEYPNAAFAAALRRQVGDEGCILVWASHERNVLRAVRRQLEERGEGDAGLLAWLDDVTEGDRIVDMNRLTLKQYFHPRMGGRTSLKVVADAVWRANPAVRARLPQYVLEVDGELQSPYRALPPLIIDGDGAGGGRLVSVAEGNGAILAYYEMMERLAANATLEWERWRQLLRQYCQLDTLAMVMVWWHWRELIGE